MVLPFLAERLLEDPRGVRVVKALTVLAAAAGIGSLMLLAVIRGNLLAQQVQSTPAVVIDDSQPAPEAPNTFYGSTLGLLRLATVLLSLAIELGGGLALREGWKASPDASEDWAKLRDELSLVQLRRVEIVREVILGALLLTGQIFQQQSTGGDRRMLVLFSDMRNTTPELNQESSRGRSSTVAPIDLHRAEVYALGVDGTGIPTARWHEIERFWNTYIHDSRASLSAFSALRSLPEAELK